ncbi:hypothetical protein N7G274_001088 [Stereocaulon virgatum]|uniref:Uncharacterized protein n=1 Tax=Stereocaulon virgatum TaxID=373712 RepID=A0ABR4AMU7_9LECA
MKQPDKPMWSMISAEHLFSADREALKTGWKDQFYQLQIENSATVSRIKDYDRHSLAYIRSMSRAISASSKVVHKNKLQRRSKEPQAGEMSADGGVAEPKTAFLYQRGPGVGMDQCVTVGLTAKSVDGVL